MDHHEQSSSNEIHSAVRPTLSASSMVHTIRTPQTTKLNKIAMLGNHLPRQCGIATFTTDLSEAISAEFSALECFVLAMNDTGPRHAYPARVRFEIAATDIASYRRAAEVLNVSPVDLV